MWFSRKNANTIVWKIVILKVSQVSMLLAGGPARSAPAPRRRRRGPPAADLHILFGLPGGARMWNSVSWWGETMKLTAEFLQNVSAKFRYFFKEFWIFEVCNIKSIKISDILWNSGKNPSKSRRKITDFKRFQQNFAKNLENSLNFCKILKKKSANFEIWAVRRNDNLVDLEKCWKMRLLSLS